MDATIKATPEETVIRLENGCTVVERPEEGLLVAECWAPGGARTYRGQYLAKALQWALAYPGRPE